MEEEETRQQFIEPANKQLAKEPTPLSPSLLSRSFSSSSFSSSAAILNSVKQAEAAFGQDAASAVCSHCPPDIFRRSRVLAHLGLYNILLHSFKAFKVYCSLAQCSLLDSDWHFPTLLAYNWKQLAPQPSSSIITFVIVIVSLSPDFKASFLIKFKYIFIEHSHVNIDILIMLYLSIDAMIKKNCTANNWLASYMKFLDQSVNDRLNSSSIILLINENINQYQTNQSIIR